MFQKLHHNAKDFFYDHDCNDISVIVSTLNLLTLVNVSRFSAIVNGRSTGRPCISSRFITGSSYKLLIFTGGRQSTAHQSSVKHAAIIMAFHIHRGDAVEGLADYPFILHVPLYTPPCTSFICCTCSPCPTLICK